MSARTICAIPGTTPPYCRFTSASRSRCTAPARSGSRVRMRAIGRDSPGAGSARFGTGDAELLPHAQHVERATQLDDPAAANAIENDPGPRPLVAGWRDALDPPPVLSASRPA